MGLLLNGGIRDTGIATVLGATFTLLFTGKTGLHKAQLPDTRGEV